MALFNFQSQFVAAIESGLKTHTIRALRKRPTRVGETLYLYTGLRRRGARKLLETKCTRVQEIRLVVNSEAHAECWIDGEFLAQDECEALALRDGFSSWDEMAQFWNGRYPFTGHVIHWKFAGSIRGCA